MDSTTEEPQLDDVLAQFSKSDPAPVLEPPPDVWKTLPGGYRSPDGVLHRQAVVREMTGADEEHLARLRVALSKEKASLTLQDAINQTLQLLVEGIGDLPMSEIDPGDLLLGDRTALLLFIREAAYGSNLELDIICPHCKRELSSTIDITKDVEMLELEPDTTVFPIELSTGQTAEATFPTGHAVAFAAAAAADDAPLAEINTFLLSKCILTIDGQIFGERHPLGPVEAAKELKSRDRRAIIKEISGRQPGPMLEEVSVDCVACTGEIPLPLDAFDLLFRF